MYIKKRQSLDNMLEFQMNTFRSNNITLDYCCTLMYTVDYLILKNINHFFL